MELPKSYTPEEYEKQIYEKWEKSGYFNPDNLPNVNAKSAPFTISMPPPNVTGTLHLGHAMMLVYEDLMTRYHRMKGDKTLWVPGTDHAAIATQAKVEKIIKKQENKRKEDLGRDEFLNRVRKYVDESKDTIHNQIRRMGASCDWSREKYTLDEDLSLAVNTIFKRMYDDGLIYRGDRIVNWCPRCQSTLADDEVDYKEQKAKLYTFKYSKDFPISIATTRPETKLGDTAVAVHPDDKRYKQYVGQEFEVDFLGVPLKIKIITDKEIDPDFGTGALGVTPAHSDTDWQMAEKNNLEIKKTIGQDARILDGLGEFSGLKVKEARELLVKKMQKAGLLEKEEEIDNNLSICYRCSAPIEPLPSLQWFIDVNKKITGRGKSLKELSLEVVKNGSIKIIPDRFEKVYYHWMENLRDWCISRQIWWGHRIPVYYRKQASSKKQDTISQKKSNSKSQNTEIIYFVHGTTTDNENHISTGWDGGELSELGKQQNLDLRQTIKKRGDKYDVVFCSDLNRAQETVKTIFEDSRTKIITDKRLRECNYGDLNGRLSKEFNPDKYYYIDNRHPNGENYQDIEKRIKDFLNEINEKYSGKKIAIVAHKFPQLAIEVILNNKTWKQAIDEDWRNTKNWQPGWEYGITDYRLQITDYDKNEIYVGLEPPKGEGWVQDKDTLDTWFSSALWTFSTLGWPNKTRDLTTFHPTTVMETGYDILFFWVARMIIMSTYALDQIPFKYVYLHGMVRDRKGRKMSKSMDNGIDPIEMIEKYGTDALRLSMIIGTSPGNDIKMYEEKVVGFRNFANKLWNIGRFIQLSINNYQLSINKEYKPETLADQWIISKINNLIKEVTDDLENFRFSLAGEKLYNFTWHELADWYIEITKIQNNENTSHLLSSVYSLLLKLLHPFTPFVTEAIWDYFEPDSMLIVEKWPKADRKKINTQVQQDFALIQEIVTAIRSYRKEKGFEAKRILEVKIAGAEDLVHSQAVVINHLAKVEIKPVEKIDKANLEVANLKLNIIE